MSNIKSMYRCVVCFLRADIGLFQHHVLKTLPLSCCIAFVPLSQISGLHLCIPASGLSVLSHWFIYLFCPTVSWFLWLYHEAWLRRASALWLCSSPSMSCLLSCAFCFSIYTLESIGQYPPQLLPGTLTGCTLKLLSPRAAWPPLLSSAQGTVTSLVQRRESKQRPGLFLFAECFSHKCAMLLGH